MTKQDIVDAIYAHYVEHYDMDTAVEALAFLGVSPDEIDHADLVYQERGVLEMKGTYNCPVCGWNQPHTRHAGDLCEQVRRLSLAGDELERRLRTLRGQHTGTRAVDTEIDIVCERWMRAKGSADGE